MLRQKVRLISALVLTAFVVGFMAPKALASTYGSGSYSNCAYSTGCPRSSSSSSSSSGGSTNTTPTAPILLNDFTAYTDGSGKQLDLTKNQVIYFEVTVSGVTTKYSITVNDVGTDSATITVGDINVQLQVGETKQIDVNGDGVYDISITLNSTKDGKASFTFKVLGTSMAAPGTTTPAATTPAKKSSINWLLIASIAAILLGLIIFIILFFRRRRRQQQTIWPPSQQI